MCAGFEAKRAKKEVEKEKKEFATKMEQKQAENQKKKGEIRQEEQRYSRKMKDEEKEAAGWSQAEGRRAGEEAAAPGGSSRWSSRVRARSGWLIRSETTDSPCRGTTPDAIVAVETEGRGLTQD